MAADPFTEFLGAVEALHDDTAVRVSAHTSSVSADAWTDPDDTESALADSETSTR